FRFGTVSFDKYNEGKVKFWNKVFPNRICLPINCLDLLGVIEDEGCFTKLCDEDVVHVCLVLFLEVIFMGCLLVNEVDDTLMRLVENIEALNAFPWELRRRLEEEERLLLEDKKLLEEEKIYKLEEEKRLMLEEQKSLEEKQLEQVYKKRSYALVSS
nr:phospholipase-like protein [Tanacetum cinerariifolium]